jgi:hypothetical protein
VTGTRPDVAEEVLTSPGVLGGAGAPVHVGVVATGGEPKVASVLAQGVGSLVMRGDNEAD